LGIGVPRGARARRAAATELGAGAMSLYHYDANKDDLLDGMVDLVVDEITLPSADADWRDAMRQRMLGARDALARHPWAIVLMGSRTHAGPANLHHREAMLAVLRRAGFTVVATNHGNWILDSYLCGFALQVATLPFDAKEELADMADQVFLPQIPADRYPYLNEAAAELLASGYDPANEFEVGLDLVLHALDGLRTVSSDAKAFGVPHGRPCRHASPGATTSTLMRSGSSQYRA
jgi:AcrR family transcriptional regulator